ncbi:MAG: carboxylating nicotinate-nucleotide diphosphorylase [Candidatus Zixiibacteriota bacterium]|nr:MAG: carboxylating nicotinate-nucleotide diphosphorylase [candidate division Zixibacteria bacterium]
MDKLCQQIIKIAYFEDIKTGDITTETLIPKFRKGTAIVIAKSSGILSGIEAFKYAFKLTSPRTKVTFHCREGKKFKAMEKIATIKGPVQALLKGERLALNLLSHLSGVATLTAEYANQIKDTKAKILDTRKTTPGLRWLERKAVLHGGGFNHRMGLYDMVLIKDNHITAAGGIKQVLTRVQNIKYKVEIEVANLKQLKTVLDYQPDIIMLDNFKISQLSKAVKMIKSKSPRIKVEASGGINLENIRTIAKTGVDYISIGALTHSAKAVDLSMRYIR